VNSYAKGSTVRFACTFQVAGVDTDPTAVTLRVKDPAGTTTVYTYALGQLTKDATGIYSMALLLSTAGTWYYRWEGTGAAAGADEDSLNVETGAF
jgi:hypothetical protein